MGSLVHRSDSLPQKVLVVDDHGLCRQMSARLLGHLGYDVVEAQDEVQAELTLARYQDQIAAVVLDVCLSPNGDMGFARRLEAERPDLPLLFMSGYCKEVCEALDLLGPDRQFLEKPFSISQLERAMEDLLASTPVAPGEARVGGA